MLSSLLRSTRVRAALGALAIAAAATLGITLPGGDDGGDTTTAPAAVETTAGTQAGVGPEALAPQESSAIATVLARIEAGEPHPYEEDGATFQNREGLLPQQPIGYYREYTVETPGSPDRGARRLVIGAGGETYYTDDHYSSFTQIDPEAFR